MVSVLADPRLAEAVSANERLFNLAIRRGLLVERFKMAEVRRIINVLDREVLPDLLRTLERRYAKIKSLGFDPGPAMTRRLKQLIVSTNGTIKAGMASMGKTLRNDLQKFALTDAQWQAAAMKSVVPSAINVAFNVPDIGMLRSVVTSRPIRGRFLEQWVSTLTKSSQDRIESALRIGIAQGEGIGTMQRRLRQAVALTKREATVLTRTAVNHVSAHAREATYEENQDVVKGVQWVSTLDSRTSFICQSLDGQRFKVGEGERPPAHHQCRSTTIPILKSFKELGIPAKELSSTTRASMNGQVPAKQTYGQWLKKQPKVIQNEALGPTRANLFRRGELKITQLVDQTGRPLTLDELETRSGLAVKASEPLLKSSIPSTKSLKFDSSKHFNASNAWEEGLSHKQRVAIERYTGDSYRTIKAAIRGQRTTATAKQQAFVLEEALSSAPNGSGIVWRGVTRLDPKIMSRLKRSKTIVFDSPTSTSLDRGVAESFLKGRVSPENSVVFKIRTKTGVDLRSFTNEEMEVLVRTNTRYRVVSIKEVSASGKLIRASSGSKYTLIELEEIVVVGPTRSVIDDVATNLRKIHAYRKTSIQLSGMDPSTAIEVQLALEKFAASNPGLANKIKSIRMGSLKDQYSVVTQRGSKFDIVLSKRAFGNKSTLRELLSREAKSGWLAGDSVEHLIFHELSHVIQLSTPRAVKRAMDYIVKNPVRGRVLSRYAATDRVEAFAEAFAKALRTPSRERDAWLRGFVKELRAGFKAEGLELSI